MSPQRCKCARMRWRTHNYYEEVCQFGSIKSLHVFCLSDVVPFRTEAVPHPLSTLKKSFVLVLRPILINAKMFDFELTEWHAGEKLNDGLITRVTCNICKSVYDS